MHEMARAPRGILRAPTAPVRARRWALPLLAALAAAPVAGAAAPAALAAPTAIERGDGLDWGLRESWRRYVGAGGTTASDGATVNPDGTFRFPIGGGSYDPRPRLERAPDGPDRTGRRGLRQLQSWRRVRRADARARLRRAAARPGSRTRAEAGPGAGASATESAGGAGDRQRPQGRRRARPPADRARRDGRLPGACESGVPGRGPRARARDHRGTAVRRPACSRRRRSAPADARPCACSCRPRPRRAWPGAGRACGSWS